MNLIGEHTDYNDGFALPAAIQRAAWVAIQRRTDTKVVVYSATVDEKFEFDVMTMRNDHAHGWANYPKGVLHALQNRGWKLEGMHIYLESDVPMAGGMSSSAAIECATMWAVQSLFPYTLDRLSMVKLCQRAENAFVGVQCGIMDQYASAFGRKGHAMFLDCRALKHEHVPVPLEKHRLLLVNSGVKRKLASSEYNKRRQECADAVKALKPKFPKVAALRDLLPAELSAAGALLTEVQKKRVDHVVSENSRVQHAVAALKKGDMAAFGRLLNETHKSLKDLYEVSCPELDLLQSTAASTPGVLGARMMGGGFGGCLLALIETDKLEAAQHAISRVYQHRFGHTPACDVMELSDGAAELTADPAGR